LKDGFIHLGYRPELGNSVIAAWTY